MRLITDVILNLVAAFGMVICSGRAMWALFQPRFIPDIIQRLPLLTFKNRPNRLYTGILFTLGALICFMAIAMRSSLI
ncbi:MAG: hypothetical protein EOO14_13640 [Chitinophagaceae bacterium]|nr:MAG: hypothetical protein EOO14_13640 [Chitinophagaceae bacterium]